MRSRFSSPVHPILLSIYPLLALLAANPGQLDPADALRALGVVLGVGAIAWALAGLVLRDGGKGAVLASLAVVLLFSYGHLYAVLRELHIGGEPLGRHRYLVPAGIVLVAGAAIWLRRGGDVRAVNAALNAVAVVAVAVPLLQLAGYQLRVQGSGQAAAADLVDPATGEVFELKAPPARPDVYFIVLDAYARGDTMASLIGYDNSEFLAELEKMGFFVAECAQSNYSQSELTLASTLNMAYLEALGDSFQPNRDDRTPLRPLIQDNLVRRTFADLGYEIVAFETGFPFSEWETADRYLRPDLAEIEGAGLLANLNGFESLLLRSSAGLLLIDFAHLLPPQWTPDYQFEVRAAKQRTLFALDSLSDLPEEPRPLFVFAHIVSPHRPFVFGPGGDARVKPNLFEYETQAERMAWYRQGYSDQVEYLNQLVLPVLRRMIASSDPAPVILLQSDHGPEEGSAEDRMGILSAIYWGARGQEDLHPRISPVNHFRLVFNEVYGGDLPLLPDRSYYSQYNRPYDFRLIANDDCAPDGG